MSEMADVLVNIFLHDLNNQAFSMGADLRLILMRYGNIDDEVLASIKEAHAKAIVMEKIIREQYRLWMDFRSDEIDLFGAKLDIKADIIQPALREFACMLEQEEGGSFCNLGEKNICVELDLPDKLPTVSGRKALLVSVFRNIIGNAVEHGGREAIKISISARDMDGKCEVVVANDGNPIKEDIAKRIFKEPSLSGGGKGRGLYQVGKVVEMHGGEIFCDTESQTPRFVITLLKS